MDVSEGSQDALGDSPSSLNESLAQNAGESIPPPFQAHETSRHPPSSCHASRQEGIRHYGLLGETPGTPFDDETWKDWVLTPLELRHSLAPKEDIYADFPNPGTLPAIPCVVRFDIVKRYPCDALCTIGCARSDISNGWVVTHSKTLLVDNTEATQFVNAVRYRANEIELIGNTDEDAIRLRFDYRYTFEPTIFEHAWLLDLQRRYRSTYSLKSTLSEYNDNEELPRGTLTPNGSWNHRTQGELSEDAGFSRRTEESQWNGYEREGKEVGEEYDRQGDEKREGKKKAALQEEESFDISSTRATSILEPDGTPLPRTYMIRADPPLSPLELAYPRPLDTPFPVEKQRVSEHEGLDLITKVASALLQTENGDVNTESRSSTPLLQYPESDRVHSGKGSNATNSELPTIQPHPIFPAILPPNALHPGGTFIELRTDQLDIWGYNDAESTIVRLQDAPLYATSADIKYATDPPTRHPLWNEDRGCIERIRTMKLYDGQPWFSSQIREIEFLDLSCEAADKWLDDGDTIIGTGVADLCARMRAEFIHPDSLKLFEADEVREKLNRQLQQAYLDFELPDRPHCLLDSTLPLDSLPEFDTERDPQLGVGATLHTAPGNYFDDVSFFRTAYKDISQSRYPQTRNNIWRFDIMRLRRLRLRITQLIQHITDYFLRGPFREIIDALPVENPVRHFFYHHCSIFRLLDPDLPLIIQGFNQRCIHSLNKSQEPIYEEHPYPSDNPLVTIDEESYLAYVGKVFELAGRIPLCNAVRHLRRLTCFMEVDVRHLLEEGYLDPTYYYDGRGERRAIIWRSFAPADL